MHSEPHSLDDRMPPAPQCEYYWPPALERCARRYEEDVLGPKDRQVPVRRALILGAGFSRSFSFATSDEVVGAVMSFFRDRQPNGWYRDLHDQLCWLLDNVRPGWQDAMPTLYEFLDILYPECRERHGSPGVQSSDPLALFEEGVSWEAGNCRSWVKAARCAPAAESHRFLHAFEALLGVFLLEGRTSTEVAQEWALEVFKQVEATDAILTLNWDVIPEFLMVTTEKPFCRYDWTGERTKLIKLHGSVDLFGDPSRLMRRDLRDMPHRFECVTDALWRARTSDDVLVRTMEQPGPSIGRTIPPAERYSKACVLIMPPYSPWGYGYELIQFNWRKAQTALERAREVYIVGYSIPDDDTAFHSLSARVVSHWDDRVAVHVWNPDPRVGERAKRIFGRRRVTVHEGCAESFRFQ